jgi:hypothetical protein
MRPTRVAVLLIASVSAFSGACGGTPPDPSSSPPPASGSPRQPTCSLLTDDDIRSVMSVAPGPSRFENNQCIWPSADGSNDFLVQLTVSAVKVGSYDELAKLYREEMNTDPVNVIHRIDNVGQFAIGFNDTPMVQVYQHSTMVAVATFGHPEKHALELAQRALARLN